MDHDQARELLPDAAAGVCEPAERADLERHLASCPECRKELASLREAVALLTGAPPLVDPPRSLRERVLTIPHGGPSAARPNEARRRRIVASRGRRWPLRLHPLLAGALAASLVLAVALAVLLTHDGGFAAQERIAFVPHDHAGGVFLIGRSRAANVPVQLRVWGLSRPRHNGFYEAWLGKRGQRYSLGKFTVDEAGRATVQLNMPAGTADEYRWVWITREADDGDPRPSSDTVLRARI